MQPKVSLIIPVYKAEEFISRSLGCALNQTLDEMEIILVDDHGGDGAILKAREIADNYHGPKNIIFGATECNSGPGVARNVGMSLAAGEYIAFLDSDDVIPGNYCEALYNTARNNSADIACCDISIGGKIHLQPELSDRKRYLRKYISRFYTFIYKREFLLKEGISFPESRISEDTCFLLCCLVSAVNTAQTHEVQYCYCDNFTSLSHSASSFKAKQRMRSFKACKKFTARYSTYRKELIRIWGRKFIGMAVKDLIVG